MCQQIITQKAFTKEQKMYAQCFLLHLFRAAPKRKSRIMPDLFHFYYIIKKRINVYWIASLLHFLRQKFSTWTVLRLAGKLLSVCK